MVLAVKAGTVEGEMTDSVESKRKARMEEIGPLKLVRVTLAVVLLL